MSLPFPLPHVGTLAPGARNTSTTCSAWWCRSSRPWLHDALLDGLFQAAADRTEQAIIHALWHATSVTGRAGHQRRALRELPPSGQVPSVPARTRSNDNPQA